MSVRLEDFELKYLGYSTQLESDARLYSFNFRLTPMVIAGTMLGDANFRDVTVRVRMPYALAKKWKLGTAETQVAFAFAYCHGIGLDLDSEYVDVGSRARQRRCPLMPEPLPNVDETWVYACSKAISFFPGIIAQERSRADEDPVPVERAGPSDRPMGKIGWTVTGVIGFLLMSIVVWIVEKVFNTNTDGAVVITILLIFLGVLGHRLSKANTEISVLQRKIYDYEMKKNK